MTHRMARLWLATAPQLRRQTVDFHEHGTLDFQEDSLLSSRLRVVEVRELVRAGR